MSAYLLDTQILLWAAGDPARLSPTVAGIITDPANDVVVSAVSVAEIVIKQSIGKLSLPVGPTELCRRMGFEIVPLTAAECAFMSTLPLRHRDPFDRLLIAQSGQQQRTFISADTRVHEYVEIDIVGNH